MSKTQCFYKKIDDDEIELAVAPTGEIKSVKRYDASRKLLMRWISDEKLLIFYKYNENTMLISVGAQCRNVSLNDINIYGDPSHNRYNAFHQVVYSEVWTSGDRTTRHWSIDNKDYPLLETTFYDDNDKVSSIYYTADGNIGYKEEFNYKLPEEVRCCKND